MTNEEIIRHTRYLAKKHQDDTVLTFETNFHVAFTDIANHIEEQAEENTKLKAEIEQLKERIEIKDNNFELYSDALDEIERLKSELKYATSLMPKICETCKHEDELGYEEPCNSCNGADKWELKQ